MNRMTDGTNKLTIGWREWLALPDIGIPAMKAKVDTGARTSALHAFEIEPFTRKGKSMVRVKIHPYQKNTDYVKEFEAEVLDQRWVSDSGGHREQRYVIMTTLELGGLRWQAEITLTNRDSMKFRMLLGRTAMRGRLSVDPAKSYLVGKKPPGRKRPAKQS